MSGDTLLDMQEYMKAARNRPVDVLDHLRNTLLSAITIKEIPLLVEIISSDLSYLGVCIGSLEKLYELKKNEKSQYSKLNPWIQTIIEHSLKDSIVALLSRHLDNPEERYHKGIPINIRSVFKFLNRFDNNYKQCSSNIQLQIQNKNKARKGFDGLVQKYKKSIHHIRAFMVHGNINVNPFISNVDFITRSKQLFIRLSNIYKSLLKTFNIHPQASIELNDYYIDVLEDYLRIGIGDKSEEEVFDFEEQQTNIKNMIQFVKNHISKD